MLRDGSPHPLMPLSTGATEILECPSSRMLGERHRVGLLEIPEHEHQHFCIHLQTSGLAALQWWSDGKHGVEAHRPNSMILLPPGTRDRLRWEGSSERYVLSLDADYVKSVAQEMGLRGLTEFRTHWHLYDVALQRLLSKVCQQFAGGWVLGKLCADLHSLRLAESLLVSHTFAPCTVRPFRAGLDHRRLLLSMEFLTDNLHRDVGLVEVAHAVGLSPFHFARMFRQQTGNTPFGYLAEQRIRRARLLLKHTALPIEAVAQEVGFTNACSFSRAFRMRANVSPKQWRQVLSVL